IGKPVDSALILALPELVRQQRADLWSARREATAAMPRYRYHSHHSPRGAAPTKAWHFVDASQGYRSEKCRFPLARKAAFFLSEQHQAIAGFSCARRSGLTIVEDAVLFLERLAQVGGDIAGAHRQVQADFLEAFGESVVVDDLWFGQHPAVYGAVGFVEQGQDNAAVRAGGAEAGAQRVEQLRDKLLVEFH